MTNSSQSPLAESKSKATLQREADWNRHRGDRLSPSRSNPLYWHLITLRQGIEEVIGDWVVDHHHGSLADYGCGNMPYRTLFEPHVDRYIGCDLCENELADSIVSPDGIMTFEAEEVGFVLSSQVLEHVPDPAAYLREARRVLAREGKLILSTHGVWSFHPDPTDYWRWTCDGLKMLVEDAGFEIDWFKGLMGPEATALQMILNYQLRSRQIKGWRKDWRIRQMQRQIEAADRRCPGPARDRDACVYLLVASPSGAP